MTSSMFVQEKVAELERQLFESARRVEQEQKNSERLADLLRTAKSDAIRVEKERDQAREDNKSLAARLARADEIVARSAAQEKAANAAESRALKAEAKLAKADADLAKAKEANDSLRALRSDLQERNQKLEGEIGPFRNLIAALKAKAEAEAAIAKESAKLG